MRALLVAAVLLTGCGMPQPASRTAGVEVARRVVLAVMGGNASCKPDATGASTPYGMDMYTPFKQLADELRSQEGLDVAFFLSCHNDDAAVHYYSSEEPDALAQTTTADVPAKLAELVGTRGDTRFVMAGHSYGGWLAMKAGLALGSDVALEALLTIDPISRETCSFATPGGCTSAPTDIAPADKRALRDRTQSWVNFYETGTFYLHSSAMAEASKNVQIQTTHFAIDTHRTVWTELAGVVRAKLTSE